jgi:hypothetical protein
LKLRNRPRQITKPGKTALAHIPEQRAEAGSGTLGSAFIALKNLQKKRICHVPMLLAKAVGGVLYHRRFPAGTL